MIRESLVIHALGKLKIHKGELTCDFLNLKSIPESALTSLFISNFFFSANELNRLRHVLWAVRKI